MNDLQKTLDKINRINQAINKAQAPFDQINRIHQAINKMQVPFEQINRMHKTIERMNSAQRHLREFEKLIPKQISDLNISNNKSEILLHAIALSAEQILFTEQTDISKDVLIESNLLDVFISTLTQLTDGYDFSDLITWIKAQSPSVRGVLDGIIATIIINALSSSPISTDYREEFIDRDSRSAAKSIYITARQEYYPEDLKGHKFVSISNGTLNVREGNSTKSAVIDSLKNGTIVKVIKKSRSWTEVEYEDYDTGEVYTGWIFSRYIHKFRF